MSASDNIPDRTGLCICLSGLAIALMLIPNAGRAASFDCDRASAPVETTICSNARLSRLDGEMGSAFERALDRFPRSRDRLLAAQRAWLDVRDSLCHAADAACLRAMTKQRVQALSALAGLGAPGAQRSGETGRPDGWDGIPASVMAAHRAASDCEPPGVQTMGSIDPITARPGGSAILYALPCTAGAYNVAYRLYVRETGDRDAVRTLYFARYSDSHHWAGTDVLYNIDVEGPRLTAFYKGRGLGDCGTKGEWTWHGHNYRLDRYKAQADCRGISPENWPAVFPR